MPGVTYSPASYAVRSVARLGGGNASVAMGALLAFVIIVFSCIGTMFPVLAPFVPAKGVAAVGLAGLFISIVFYRRQIQSGGWITLGLLTYLLIALASRFWSAWPEMSSSQTGDLVKFVAIYFLVVNVVDSPARLRILMTTIVVGALIPCLGAIKGYFLGEYLVEGNRAAWISIFGNPDDLAYYLLAATPMALALREMSVSKTKRALLLVVVALYSAAIFLGASRGGILTLGILLAFWWVRELRRGRLGVWIAVAGVAALLFVPSHVWNRTKTLADYREDTSAMGRIWTTQAGLNMFVKSPWGGMGAGTFAVNYPSFAPIDAETDIAAMAPHNSFIQVLAEEGLFGFLGFLVAIIAGFWLTRWRGGGSDPVAAGAAGLQGSLIAFFLSSLTGGLAVSWPIYWTLGMAAALPRIREMASASPAEA